MSVLAICIRYTVKGDGFSVLLDARPAMRTTKVTSKDGKERTKRFLTTTVNCVVYSIDVVENLKPGQPLEEFIAESTASLQTNRATKTESNCGWFSGNGVFIADRYYNYSDAVFRDGRSSLSVSGPTPVNRYLQGKMST